jgi:hypothetical protein
MARINLAAIRQLVRSADPTTPTPSAGDEYFNSTTNTKKVHNGTGWIYANEFVLPFSIQGALSVGVTGRKQRIYNRTGSPWTIVGVQLWVNTAPVGATATLQVNKNGASAFTISVATTVQGSSSPSATNIAVADGDYLDVDVTAVGSTTPGSDATLTLSVVS